MAVKVDGMSDEGVLDEEIYPFTLEGQLNHAAWIREARLVIVELHQGRVLPAHVHRGGVELPTEEILCVPGIADRYVPIPNWRNGYIDVFLYVRHEIRQEFVFAYACEGE